MEDPRQRLTTCISTAELERRWLAVREMMNAHNIDFLVMRNDDEFLGGYVRWFSDLSARNSYPFTVIFAVHEEMTLISHGGTAPAEPSPPEWAARGVKRRLSAPYIPSLHYTSAYDAELAVGALNEKKGATIGLVGRSFMPMTFYEYLTTHLPGFKFVDATDGIDQIKVIKSPEEIALIRRTAQIQDEVMAHVKGAIRPGRRDFEVSADAHHLAMLRGSERQLILVGSNPPGVPGGFQHRHFQNRMMKEGDQVSVLVEVNGPGGFYAEIGRIFSIGKPSQQLQEAFGVALEAQQLTIDSLRPGAIPNEIWQANNEFLKRNGYRADRRLYAHGQGYDLVERPAIRYDEPMEIRANMNIVVHPTATNPTVWANLCDNYLVTEMGAGPCLHSFPKEIVVL